MQTEKRKQPNSKNKPRENKKTRKMEQRLLRRGELEGAGAEGERTDGVCGFETGSHEETLLSVVVHAVFVEDEAHCFPCLLSQCDTDDATE